MYDTCNIYAYELIHVRYAGVTVVYFRGEHLFNITLGLTQVKK